MNDSRGAHAHCGCDSCTPPPGLTRRTFLSSLAATAVTLPSALPGLAAAAPARPTIAGPGAPRRTLIRGGTVLTMDSVLGDFARADILVEDGFIKDVRPDISVESAEVIEAGNAVVIPGFVDTHRHMWLGYLKNLLPDGSFGEYQQLVQRQLGAQMTPEDVYAANLLSALAAIDSGVTTVLDWSQISNTPANSDSAISALKDSGIRAVYAFGNPQAETGRFQDAKYSKFPEDIRRLRSQYFSTDDQLVTLFMAAPTGGVDVALQSFRLAREVGAPISIHVGMGAAGRSGLLEKLGALGELRSDTTYIHCCTINDKEWRLIRDTGGTVSISGITEMLMGHGHPPIQRALDLGLRPSLSLDVETTAPNDFFAQMRTVLAVQKNDVWARRLAGDDKSPDFLKARDVLEFATIEGARANHLAKKVGSLSIGKKADIVLLRRDLINVMPMNNAVGAVVSGMTPQNVDSVLIDGVVRKRHGHLVGVDWGVVSRLAEAAQARNFRRSGLERRIV